jgi:putative oxidoreductase
MNVHALLFPDPRRTSSIVLLLVRVAAGLMLAPHGYAKLMSGPAGLAGGLAQKGLPAPTLLAWCATLSELLGGLLVALGLLTRPAAAAAAFTMFVAWTTMHLADAALLGASGGARFEYPFLLSVCFVAVAIAGGGRYSLDAVLFGRKLGVGRGVD